ncbi:uncharacterized protein OCT59_021705 [Rhizophagus irregularis]|uniref:Uncharacterized protein n=2 Tax=Rhizophagus irregularis TaxID=588596 RepID=U9UIH5_RHIID|nr:hypothetical protein GLOIN_2v1705943 [Rhizophagus irregularis DAOM 181602=DAOM 197198]EXX75123.1 hypothetical protein RirG_044410 [Rhizophagus irregularis DAOM 197198w]POG61208.1 hypothetical protein GLOIN_2v1705943 [Rhizophagus irregularis DAOM 181602=DAOM 197198]UZO28163.1 hypothetical protein OCT59_021705 [Rhizophagus irregularis]GBC30474.1 hypothetical protein GLOIN_2v1705943 [Rhizophagus irregularis DAOM 181602=DAOM 197198]|eukprot:XP_025168074.1 hypothetical protein GLOIN_2v1705943 [Rhizophagus irregularis DAOM 181602=DAOM 197198]
MDLLKKFDELNNRLSTLLEENKELKRQNKNFQEENHVLKEKLNERDYENLQEENKKLKQHVLNLEHQKNDQLRKYKNLQEENKSLNMKETQFQQHIQNLEKQKSEQFEIFSQNLEKALGKLRLDDLHEDNVNNPQKDFILSSDELDEDNVNDPKKDESLDYMKDSTIQKVTIKKVIHPIDKSSFNKDNIRVVVGLDFGTTYSGFSYCHVADSENITTNDQWPENFGNLKTNTVLQYDYEYDRVESWGLPALAKRPSRRKNENRKRPVELFKLHLGNLSENLKPKLPIDFDYKKAITDYLREIGKLIKETIELRFQGIDFHKHVLLVLTVPMEYLEEDIAIMRECVYEAELIAKRCSNKLQFTTESEAAAIYCMQNVLKEHDLLTSGKTIMIVDCGGGTVDLTIHKLIGNNQLSEITEGTGDFCGSTFIDNEFIGFLRKKLGIDAINSFRDSCYSQFQSMIQEFCQRVKLPFTGDDLVFSYELDIEITAPVLLQYIDKETRFKMEENEWLFEINYEDIKAMFDPVVDRIIRLIHLQLSNAREECSAMFLVGGFSESKYLQKRIKQEFQREVKNISVPKNPIAATSRGAALYGFSLFNSKNDNMKVTRCIIATRILKYTYGIKVRNYWLEGDPIERKIRDGRIDRFHCIAKRGIQVNANEEFTTFFTPLSPMQTRVCFKIYYTKEYSAKYCDEPGMNLLGKLIIDLSGSGHLDKLLFGVSFGQMEFAITVKNETSGQYCRTKFEIDI